MLWSDFLSSLLENLFSILLIKLRVQNGQRSFILDYGSLSPFVKKLLYKYNLYYIKFHCSHWFQEFYNDLLLADNKKGKIMKNVTTPIMNIFCNAFSEQYSGTSIRFVWVKAFQIELFEYPLDAIIFEKTKTNSI